LIVPDSWPKPLPPGQRTRTITLVRCAQCQGGLHYTMLKGQPRQEDHELGCQAFSTAIRVVRYAGELKLAAARPDQGGWRSNRRWRKYVLQNAKKLSAAVRDLSNQYQAECQAPGRPAGLTRMTETLMRACGQLALGEAPAPVAGSSG
jgi:hypothetical protein